MNNKRTHVVMPERLVREIDTLVGARRRSSFLAEAAEKEMQRVRQLRALERAVGSWKDQDHPELAQGAAKWVRKLRRDSGRRVSKAASR